MRMILEQYTDGAWLVRKLGEDGKVLEEVPRAYAVPDLVKLLGRTRRHVYRYIKGGWLAPVGKVLGEWLVDARGVDYLKFRDAHHPLPIPASARAIFQEYRIEDLHPIRDAVTVIHRMMESGGEREARWLFRQYSREALRHWLMEEGWRLSPRSAVFWGTILGVNVPKKRKMN
jgi:hypothetical protein